MKLKNLGQCSAKECEYEATEKLGNRNICYYHYLILKIRTLNSGGKK